MSDEEKKSPWEELTKMCGPGSLAGDFAYIRQRARVDAQEQIELLRDHIKLYQYVMRNVSASMGRINRAAGLAATAGEIELLDTVRELRQQALKVEEKKVDEAVEASAHLHPSDVMRETLVRTRAVLGAYKTELVSAAAERVMQQLETLKVENNNLRNAPDGNEDYKEQLHKLQQSVLTDAREIAQNLEAGCFDTTVQYTWTGAIAILKRSIRKLKGDFTKRGKVIEAQQKQIHNQTGEIQNLESKLEEYKREVDFRMKKFDGLEQGMKTLRTDNEGRGRRITELENALTALIDDPELARAPERNKQFENDIRRAINRPRKKS